MCGDAFIGIPAGHKIAGYFTNVLVRSGITTEEFQMSFDGQ